MRIEGLSSRLAAALVLLGLTALATASRLPEYNYVRYSLRKKSRDGKMAGRRERYCSDTCLEAHPRFSAREIADCARRCASPACFDEIYGPDMLEDGEIDIRSTSFQGCVAKELRAMRNRGIHLDKYGNAVHGTEESAADEDDDERDNSNHSPDGR